jgi:hypothetical protein
MSGAITCPKSWRRRLWVIRVDLALAESSLYELLLRLNLNVSHLDEARETYVRRLGLR